MAEARSAVSEPRVDYLEFGRDPQKDILRALRRSVIRRFFRFRNAVYNGIWPTSIWNLKIAIVFLSVLLTADWEFAKPLTSRLWTIGNFFYLHEGIPFFLRTLLVASLVGVVFFIVLMYVRRNLLRILLAYRGWMYQPPRTQSVSTIVWAFIVRLVSGYSPSMYSYQQSLPRMPVPPLKVTLEKLIESLEPLYDRDSEELQAIRKHSKEFEQTLAPKLQKILQLKSWWSRNWVTDWWEKYVYLMGRSPISINSNYYVLDQSYWKPTSNQISRAASVVYNFMDFKRLCDREMLPPLVIRKTIPLCMAQYERIFSTVRVPGEDHDQLVHYSSAVSKHVVVLRKGIYYKLDLFDANSQPLTNIFGVMKNFCRSSKEVAGPVDNECYWSYGHVVVLRKGIYYKLDLFDANSQPLTKQSLEQQLEWIVKDADRHQDEYSEWAKALSSLTGIERGDWARTRRRYFSSGINKGGLEIIEKAVFLLVLETVEFESFSDRGKFLLHGDGTNIWFDKSFNVVVFKDGRYGLNCEHAWADAPVMAHLSEYNMTEEILGDIYDEEGKCRADANVVQAAVKQPTRLLFNISVDLEKRIENALQIQTKNNADLDLCVIDHDIYGKGFIKTCKVSPDAYIQLAIQLAYYKSTGKLALTYESSMTRLYLRGRTETVRSLSKEMADFVKSMVENNKSREERIRLMRAACDKHQGLYRDAMNGMGIDRHLFGLYVVCKGLGHESEFLRDLVTHRWQLATSQQPQQQIEGSPSCLDPKFSNQESAFLRDTLLLPWTLSTSQQPQTQTANSPDCNSPQFQDKLCPGGGFGPVSDTGYGISYMIPGDNKIFFHISSKVSTEATDSKLFAKQLFGAFHEMRELFQSPTENGAK